jgi:hypothetical protein
VSIASDGAYLYIYDESIHAILKIGTGFVNTLQGHQYGVKHMPQPVRSMAYVAGYLYVLLASDPASEEISELQVYSTTDFKVL